jgi:uncharacterized Zn-binding protein involved in type VI secretion
VGQPAAVLGDAIRATCAIHQMPNPTSGAPQPAGPLPFSSPLTTGLSTTVLIGGKAAAVLGSSGINQPPHVGLHASDPFMVPTQQQGRVVTGSATVLFDGKPAATAASQCTACLQPGAVLQASATTVLIGG